MPSQHPGYQYDIFISYRQNDNRSGWVTEFVKALEGELSTTIKDPVSVYFDVNPHDGLLETHNVDKSLEGKLKCLVFIPIVSQTYCDHKSFAWQNEFLAYNAIAKKDSFGREVKLADGNMACRILPVKIHNLDLADQKILETELGSVPRGIEFIYKEPGVNRPLRPDDDPAENQNKTKYRNQVNKVAHSVKEIIAGLKNFGNPKFHSSSTESITEEIKASSGKSIVVLPFEDMSPDKDQEYFSDGLTEEVIADLSKLQELSVISRSSAFTFKGTRKKVREIAEEVNVRYVLEGSVRKEGKNLRITAQLIDGATDTHAWSEKYAGTLDHVFEFQEQLSRSIVAALKIHLNPSEDQKLGERPIKDIRAYEHYMKARNGLSSQVNEGLRQGLQHAKEALRIVGDNEILYGTMASINYAIWLNGFGDADKTEISDTEICKEKVLQLNPESPYGFFAAGILDVMHSKPQEAVRNFKKTIALNPSYSEASQILGTIYLDVGRPEAADPLLRLILSLDPLVAFNQAMIGYLEWQQGRFKSALPYWKKMIELGPSIPVCSWSYACALASAGLRNESCAHVDKMSEDILASPFGKMALLLKYGLSGDKSAALKVLTPDFLGFAKSLPFASRDVAGYYGMFGEIDEAINLVENAINLGYINYPFLALHHPFYGPLRGHPRFIKLMERIRPLWEAFEI